MILLLLLLPVFFTVIRLNFFFTFFKNVNEQIIICCLQTIGACSNTVKMALITEAMEVKTSQKLLGESECSWGPKFWCASKDNAAKCQVRCPTQASVNFHKN